VTSCSSWQYVGVLDIEEEVETGAPMAAPNEDDGQVGADEALTRLMEGNARFLRGESRFARGTVGMFADLVKGQHPFAAILGCSDSRVPPELIFDAEFGDLFVIRVAGNVVSPEVWGSLQYAGTHLNTQLFMVLGHEGCGAVQAALAAKFQGAQERSRIQLLLQNMLPGLDEIDPQLPSQQKLDRAVESNVRWSMRQFLETPEGGARTAKGRIKVVGAVYEIATGRVRLLA
jgi:carbonic anhydrase